MQPEVGTAHVGILAMSVALSVACGGRAARTPTGATTPRPAVSAVPTPGADANDDEEDAIVRALCGGRTGCTKESVQAAGTDQHGRALRVFALSLPATEERWCDGVDGVPDEPVPPEPGEDAEPEPATPGPTEYWLIVGDDPAAPSRQLLLDLCNDGYGAAGVGEDAVELSGGALRYTQSGGSAWRWSNTTTVQTSTLRFGHADSLGALHRIRPEDAVCEVRNGRLEPRITRTFRPGEPVIAP